MTRTEVRLCAVLLLAFLAALFAMAASPTEQILFTRSGGCPDTTSEPQQLMRAAID